jgi:TP901 family phage tail tape measure protein
MRQVGFKIVVDSSDLKGGAMVDVKNAIADLRKIETSLKVDGRTDKGIQKNAASLDKMKTSLEGVNPVLERYVSLMREAVGLSIPRGAAGVGGSGGGINGGSRVGVNASAPRVAASAFSGFVRRGDSFTSQIGSIVSGASRFASLGNLGLGVATFASAEAIRQSVKIVEITREFSGASADLAARLGTTRAGVKELTDDAIRLGDSMVFTASEIVGVQVELAKLGFSKEVIKQITDDVARFAVVSGGSVQDSAKLAGATLQSFEKDASQIEDVVKLLGLSTAKTAIDFQSLQQGAIQLFSTARSFGLELSDTLALLGALKNAGLSDSVAATASRNILLNLADDGGKLRDVLRQLGTKDVKGLEGIVGALKALDVSGINLAETFELTDKRSVNAFNTFLRGADSLEGLRDSINGSNEEFRIMERERLNSLDGDIKLFKSNVDSLALSLGAEGLVRSFVQLGTEGLKNIKQIIESFRLLKSINEDSNGELFSLLDILGDVNAIESERVLVIAELKTKYSEYVKELDLENLTLADILKIKKDISIEDSKKSKSIEDQSILNSLLKEELELTQKTIDAKRKNNLSNSAIGDQNAALSALRGSSSRLADNQKELGFNIANIDVKSLSLEGLAQLQNRSKTRDAIGALANQKIKQIDKEVSNLGFGKLKPTNRVEALGDLTGRKSILDKENAEIDKVLKTLDKNSAFYVKLIEIQQKNEELKNSFRTGTGITPTDKRKKTKEDEVFIEGSLAFYENELRKADEILKRISQTSDKFVGQAEKVGELREKVEIARKKQEELTKTRRELAEEEFKQAKEAIEFETKGERGEIVRLDRDIRITQAEIAKAEKLGDSTDDLGLKLKELKDKYTVVFKEYLRGLVGDKIQADLEKQIQENNRLAENRIADGENPVIVELENVIKNADISIEKLSVLRGTLKNEEEANKIDLEIKKLRKQRNNADVGLKIEAINEEFLEASTGLTSLDVALAALKRGDLKKAQEAIDIYENEVARLEIIRDRDILLAKGDQAGAKKKEFDLDLLGFNIQKSQIDRYKEKLLEVVDALNQVGRALIDLQRVNLENDRESRINKIEQEYEARIKAAKGNADEEERIKKELERRKAEIEKKAAKERQALAIKEAIIGIALSIIQARTIVGRIAAAAVGAVQIATIRKQKFARGGYYTGAGSSLDETGEYSTGEAILHAGEYVVRRKTVQKYPHIIKALDQDRLRYAQGGPNGFSIGGGGETRLSSSDIEYLTKSLSESVAASVYSSVVSATSKAYEQSTEVLRNSRSLREVSRRENYSLNSY